MPASAPLRGPTARSPNSAEEVYATAAQAWERVAPSEALEATWRLVRAANAALEAAEPWRADPGPAVDAVLGDALEVLRIVAVLASPALTRAPTEIWRRIGLTGSPAGARLPDACKWGGYPGGLPVERGRPFSLACPASTVVWCDSHCHIPYEGIGVEAIEQARAAGVTRLITVGTDAEHSAAGAASCRGLRGVWATVGLHPHDAINGVATVEPLLQGQPELVAIGECGLDYHYDYSPRPVQREAFAAQVALANSHELALVVHTREAWDDTFAILRAEGVPERTVLHCFTGGAPEARICLDLGLWLSFSGIISFKNASDIREAAALCPLDRLLVETDSPFLAPVPYRGKTNSPAYVPLVGAAVAAVKGVDVSEVEEASWAAAAPAFRLDG